MTVKQILKEQLRRSSREKCVQIGLFCWALWTRRNSWVWDKKVLSRFGVYSMAMSLLKDWHHSQETMDKGGTILRQRQNRTWSKPPEGWVKINIDAAYQLQTVEA